MLIYFVIYLLTASAVALRKESVDRNATLHNILELLPEVALRKESVDRNMSSIDVLAVSARRSPQGERG